MKTILRSLAYSLGILFIAVLINGKWFLNQDARYTYMNDYGRIDVRIDGVTEGRVKADGKEIKSHEPQWFKYENNQGNSLAFPVSYKSNHREIVLTPESSQISDNTKLMIKFMGQHYAPKNKRVPAKVKYKNIKINGEKISDKVVVWHDNGFKYYLDNFKNDERIKVSFDVYKPFSTSDINWELIIGFIAIAWGLCYTLFISKYGKYIKFDLKAKNIINFFKNEDLLLVIIDKYRSIDPVYRKSFWIIFIITNIVFGFHTINFFWGNHDWEKVLTKVSLFQELGIGRYGENIVNNILLGGLYLPVITNLLAFIGLSLTSVLLSKYWQLPKKTSIIVFCGLIFAINPFVLSWLWYAFMYIDVFIVTSIIMCAFILSEKIAVSNYSKAKIVLLNVVCIVLFNFAISVYTSMINMFAVVFLGKVFIELLNWNGNKQDFKNILLKLRYTVIDVVIAVISYWLILQYLKSINVVSSTFYNIQPISLDELPQRIWECIVVAFRQLIDYNAVFIPQISLYIVAFFSTLIILMMLIDKNKAWYQKIILVSILASMLIATKLAIMIAKSKLLYEPRIDFCGLAFFEMFIIGLSFVYLPKLKNLAYILSFIVIWSFAINDAYALKVWKLGWDSEQMLWNRMIDRLENNPKFKSSYKYDIMQLGSPIVTRDKFYISTWDTRRIDETLRFSFDTKWSPFSAIDFYYPTSIAKRNLTSYKPLAYGYKETINKLYDAGVLDKAKAWPHKDSLIIHDDIILFVTDEKELHRVKNSIAQERLTQNKENK